MASVTATLRAYEQIRARILDGSLKQGSRVREGEMSELLELSRTPVREALKLLSAEGFLESEPNKGVTVAVWSRTRVVEAYTVRATLEGLAASTAAISADGASVQAMYSVCDEMDYLLDGRQAPPIERITTLNRRLHGLIAEASGNSILIETINRLAQVPARRTFETYTIEDLRRSFLQHRQLTVAIEARDVAAAEATMRAHIFDGRARWIHSARTEPTPLDEG